MGIVDRIKDIEYEMSRTQKNKATNSHLMRLKAQLAKLRRELLAPPKKGPAGEGFDVEKNGNARVAMIGFPSVGKSSLLNKLTNTESEAASYEFTTLTCIPGNLKYKGTQIQLLDLPGIIEGAAYGRGRGRQVIAVAKSADLVLMVLDAAKEQAKNHRAILERELYLVGLRLNKTPPNIYFRIKKTGGVKFSHTVPLTQLGDDPEESVLAILQQYRIHNCDVLFREDASGDELIDVIEGNRKYVKCLYVYNKIDMVYIHDVDRLARMPHTTVCSVVAELNLDRLLELMWCKMGLVRVYTKPRGRAPDFSGPVVLTEWRHGVTIEAFCQQIHKDLLERFSYAQVWGISTKHMPQRCGRAHVLMDEDVVQVRPHRRRRRRPPVAFDRVRRAVSSYPPGSRARTCALRTARCSFLFSRS
jgi:small GTP-binding protein